MQKPQSQVSQETQQINKTVAINARLFSKKRFMSSILIGIVWTFFVLPNMAFIYLFILYLFGGTVDSGPFAISVFNILFFQVYLALLVVGPLIPPSSPDNLIGTNVLLVIVILVTLIIILVSTITVYLILTIRELIRLFNSGRTVIKSTKN